MKREIPAEVHSYDFPEDIRVPDETNDAIFLPTMGKNGLLVFFLIDFRTQRIIAFETDISKEMERFKAETKKHHIESQKPHNMAYDTLVYSISIPHQGERYDDKVVVSFLALSFFLIIDLKTLKLYHLYDENRGHEWLYSSTNEIRNGKMYTSRWQFKDMYKVSVTAKEKIDVEIVEYDIDADRFHLIDTIKGVDYIHTTKITSDGGFIILIEMNTDAVLDCPNLSNESEERQIEIQRKGVVPSDCYIYDLNRKMKTAVLRLPKTPAHIEFDLEDPCICYLSQHNLCITGDNNRVYSFGPATIEKYRITEKGEMQMLKRFEDEETVRIPGHVVFSFKGKQFIVMPSTPLKIFIVDCETMTIHKKIRLGKETKKSDFKDGPLAMLMPLRDATPYTVQAKNESRHLYYSNILTIGIYDFLKDIPVCEFRHNPGFRVLTGGHATRFDGIEMPGIATKTYEEMKKHPFKKPILQE